MPLRVRHTQAKRDAAEKQLARTVEFQRMRRLSSSVPGHDRRERNRIRNTTNLSAWQKEFSQRIDAVSNRDHQLDSQARLRRDEAEAARAARVSAARAFAEEKVSEIGQMQRYGTLEKGGHASARPICPSQMSSGEREKRGSDLADKLHRQAERRREDAEEGARQAEEARLAYEAKCAAIRANKEAADARLARERAGQERATEGRLREAKREQQVRIDAKRRAFEDRLKTVHTRHEAHIEGKVAAAERGAAEEASRYHRKIVELVATSRHRANRTSAQRESRRQHNRQLLYGVVEIEDRARAAVAERDARDQHRYERHKARQVALTTSRRLATQSLSRVRSDLSNEVEQAQIALGVASERGGKKLLKLSSSLACLDPDTGSHNKASTTNLALSSSVPNLPNLSRLGHAQDLPVGATSTPMLVAMAGEEEQGDAAARAMQKVARGRKVRKEKKAQQEAAIVMQKSMRGRLARGRAMQG